MTDFYVATTGSNANPGTQAQPVQTISQGLNLCTSGAGDRVLVEAGAYNERLFVTKNNVTVMRATPEDVPALEGGGTLQEAISLDGIANFVMDGMEVRNYYLNGLRLYQTAAGTVVNHKLRNNHIHHVGSSNPANGPNQAAINLYQGAGIEVTGNTIHHVGHGGEAFGVWLQGCKQAKVDNNVIYACRKEGVRDYFGDRCEITSNIIFMCWTGVAPNEAMGTLVSNNYIGWCTQGINPKHFNSTGALSSWGVGTASAWCRIWHNTIFQSSYAHVVTGPNGPNGDKLDVRNNIFAGFSPNAVWDNPSARSTDIIVNGNMYTSGTPRASFVYGGSFTWGGVPSFATIVDVQENRGFEMQGIFADPLLNDPSALDLDYGSGSPAAGGSIDLTPAGSARGTQLGARGLTPPAISYEEPPCDVVSSKTSHAFASSWSDQAQISSIATDTATEEWIVLDMLAAHDFNHLFLDIANHFADTNPRVVRLEYGSGSGGPWTVCLPDTTNPDSEGSSFKYELASTINARYVRFTAVSPFGSATQFIISDIRPAMLTASLGEPPPEPPAELTGAHWGMIIG